MKRLKRIIQEEINRAIYEEKITRAVNETLNEFLFEDNGQSAQKNSKKGVGMDTIERSNRRAYNNDIINGSELARRAHITKSKNDDTIRSLASKYWGKNKNHRKPSKKLNKKMHVQVNKL